MRSVGRIMCTPWCLLLVACVALTPARILAQGAGAAIEGVAVDAQGGTLPGVAVTLRNDETGVVRTAVTDAAGRYRLPSLTPGRYVLKAELQGFTTVEVTDVVISIGLELRHDFTMEIQALQETVTVTGVSPIVDTTRSEVAGLVTQQQIETLPVNTRQFLNLALLMPGTSQDGGRAFYNNVTIGAGATFYSSAFLVDGVTNTWAEQGEPRQNFPQAAVREFKVNTTQFKAEYGLATGGLVTVVTKSGTNAFRGEGFEYFRDKSLNAFNKFEEQRHEQLGEPKPGFRRNQFGLSVGGPIVRDRMHFFGAFERTQTDEFFTVNTGRPEFYSAVEGTFPRPSHTNLYLGRIDHQFNTEQTLFVRYAQEDEKKTCFQCGGTVAANSGFDQTIPRRAVAAGHTWVASPRVVNDFRFQFAYAMYQIAPAGTPIFTDIGKFPEERLQYIQRRFQFPSLRYGGNFGELGPEHRTQFRDDLTWNVSAAHDMKFGFDFSHIPFADDTLINIPGTYTFAADQLFNPNDPSTVANLRNPITFTASIPAVYNAVPTQHYAFYVQDDWRVRNNLTLNLGLRYDRQLGSFNEDLDPASFPRAIPFIDPDSRGDRNNFGPRVGFAWDVKSNGDSVVRGGAGVYYDNIRTLVNFGEWRNLAQFSIIIPNPPYPDPYLGQDPLSFASTAPPDITILSNEFVNPYSQQYNLGFTQQVMTDLAVHVDGVYTYVLRDRKDVDINPRGAGGVRPLPEWGRIFETQSIGKLQYRALFVRVDKRYSRRHQLLLSYTLANSEDNNPAVRVTNQNDWAADWGPSNVERRHTLVASGAVLLPYDITLGAVWTLRSGLPFSALAGRDLNGDGFTTDYVPGTTRNQGGRDLDLAAVNAFRAANGRSAIPDSQIESTRFNSVDMRASKSFSIGGDRKIEVLGQVFNVFGSDNLDAPFSGGRVTNALSDSFGRILTARPRQQAELGIRVVF
jgi:outer membrane receptor protein involved in Fe transport